MKTHKLQQMVAAAMLAALTCIATLVLVIPIPIASGGYINLGDCIVLLSGWFLGPVYGGAAAAIGSLLADVFTGFLAYAPATLLIKGLMAILAFLLFQMLQKAWPKQVFFSRLLAAILCELFMAGGYFLYESLLLGNGIAAAAGIPWNLLQGAAAVLLAVPLAHRLSKINSIQQWTTSAKK